MTFSAHRQSDLPVPFPRFGMAWRCVAWTQGTPMDYFSHTKNARALLEKLASPNPQILACMHGSAWRGDGAGLLRALAGVMA